MARRAKNGEFIGVVGNVSLYNYKGRNCMRIRTRKRTDKSPLIKQARTDFSVVMGLIQNMKSITDEGFRYHTKDRSAYHSALSINLDSYREAARLSNLDTLSWFSVSKGKLSSALNASATLTPDNLIEITWQGTEPGRVHANNDRVLAVAYLNNAQDCKWDDSATRQSGKVTINPGTVKPGEKIDVFLSFISKNNRYLHTDKYASNSLWINQFEI